LAIKEMPLQEKYDTLLQNYLLGGLMDKVLHDELGAADKYRKLSVEMQKKMAPVLLGPTFKLLKTIAPGRSFKQLVEQYVYMMQTTIPLSNLDLSWVSDREAVVTVKNCPMRQKMAELVKKTGANVNASECCEMESQINMDVVKAFGVDLAWQHTENGCKWTAKI
jgi:hypothetical protein